MPAFARIALAVPVLLLASGSAWSASIVDTNDAGEIAAFQSGATVQDFEGLNGLATAAPADDTTVPAANQLSKVGSGLPDVQSLPGLHFHSGGGTFGGGPGTPVAVLDVSAIGNVLAPIEINEAFTCIAAGCFLEVFFDVPVQRVGFQVGLGNVSLFVQTYGGNPLGGVDNATGTAGNFAGIVRDAPDIERLVVIANSAQGFTMDDLSYVVPEPSTALLVATGAALIGVRRRRR